MTTSTVSYLEDSWVSCTLLREVLISRIIDHVCLSVRLSFYVYLSVCLSV